ncbi:MAG: DNA-formamidopyrimidine glycosylase family protein [Nocardioides sp.]
MPELPEVEVVRAGLERHVVGTTILSVDVLHPRPVRRDPRGPAGFAGALVGRTLTGAHRRGKYFWLALDSGDALLGHLGMSGQMLVQPSTVPDERHLRVRFTLDGAPGARERQRPRWLRRERQRASRNQPASSASSTSGCSAGCWSPPGEPRFPPRSPTSPATRWTRCSTTRS